MQSVPHVPELLATIQVGGFGDAGGQVATNGHTDNTYISCFSVIVLNTFQSTL